MEGAKRGKPVLNTQGERKSEDINSNTHSSILGKRKKTREKKHWAYLQEWLDNSRGFQEEPADRQYGAESMNFPTHPTFLWPTPPTVPIVAGQRLLTAISDPSMCHYPMGHPSVPVSYSVEPVSLPLYSLYTPVPNPAWWQTPQASPSVKVPPVRHQRVNIPSQLSNSTANSNAWTPPSQSVPSAQATSSAETSGTVFASLPTGPPETHRVPESLRRRFSDPGLGLTNPGQGPSDSGLGPSDPGTGSRDPGLGPSDTGFGPSDSDSSDNSWPGHRTSVVAGLLEQVNTLYISNRRLTRALRNARSELHTLKLKATTWTDPEYQPGLLAKLVQDVREATRVRQEALMTRVQDLLNTPLPKPAIPSSDDVDQRLVRIEQQLRTLKPFNSESNGPLSPNSWEDIAEGEMLPTQPVTHQTPNIMGQNLQIADCENELNTGQNNDPEKERLKRDLEEAVRARLEAEARTHKLEQLLGVLREKINVLSGKEKQHTPSENSPEESLTSLSSSCGSPHLTMSGPVTCL